MNVMSKPEIATGIASLDQFEASLRAQANPVAAICAGLIGKGAMIPGRFGSHRMVYADYVASGRAIRQVEDFVIEAVLPYYANSHTEASFCGRATTQMREAARRVIADKCHAGDDHAVIFAGSGATAGLNKLVHLFGIRDALAAGRAAHVLVGPYEHHSNLLPWRESGAMVTEIAECTAGGPDARDLARVLAGLPDGALVIGAFSAASNVTGIGADIAGITKVMKDAGALVVWDYAGGGPYLPIAMQVEGQNIDAIVTSPHKFVGGPGASGVLIVRRDAVTARIPGNPGGGTVAFVNGARHDYLPRIEDREEGGTPNIIGDIRAALAFVVKDVIGQDFITRRNAELAARAMRALGDNPAIQLLGGVRGDRLPIVSFLVRTGAAHFDYQLFATAISDLHGIQVRGGCACAGPYVHRLLQINDERSDALRAQILAGDDSEKPGFVRLNLSFLISDDEADFILNAVADVAKNWGEVAALYVA